MPILLGAILLGPVSASQWRDSGYMYLSPRPEAQYVAPQTRLLVRFDRISPGDLTNLSTFVMVEGATSGTHTGQTRIATDNRTIVFEPSSSFATEIVTVTLSPKTPVGATEDVRAYSYRFHVSMPASLSSDRPLAARVMANEATKNSQAMISIEQPGQRADGFSVTGRAMDTTPTGPRVLANGVSVPSDFPTVVITVNGNPSPGYIFLENKDQGSGMYTMMLDNSGDPVWYRRGGGRDFKVQANGTITWGTFTGADKDFSPGSVRSYGAVDGYDTDAHELQVLENGGYMLIGGRDQTVDMGRHVAGGQPNAIVHETVVQEFTADGELIFQWRGWDHCDFNDMDPLFGDLRSSYLDLNHMNSISVDEHGDIVVSHRHLNEAVKIDRQTGEVLWRLGGAHNQFAFVNDPWKGFHGQHDVRSLGNRRYTVFDDGAMASRAVEYELDLHAMTATLVWEFRDTPDKYSWYQGSAQRLPNGNTLINWGLAGYPKAVEVDPNGVKQFEMSLLPGSDLYRSFRFPWDGVVAAPYLIVEPQVDHIALIFNRFGDRDVAYYRIYAGTTPHPTQVLQVSETTLARVTGLISGQRYYFRVTAVSTTGLESDFSNEENGFMPTEENQVLNGDFSQEKENWGLEVKGTAFATWSVADQIAHVDITETGASFSDVRLSQDGMQLIHGETYELGFRAWADTPRVIEIKLERSQTPHTDYARIGYVYVKPLSQDFRYTIRMKEPTDSDVHVVFYLGSSDIDVHIDDVFLKWSPN